MNATGIPRRKEINKSCAGQKKSVRTSGADVLHQVLRLVAVVSIPSALYQLDVVANEANAIWYRLSFNPVVRILTVVSKSARHRSRTYWATYEVQNRLQRCE